MEALASSGAHRVPWNSGRLTGRKHPLELREIWAAPRVRKTSGPSNHRWPGWKRIKQTESSLPAICPREMDLKSVQANRQHECHQPICCRNRQVGLPIPAIRSRYCARRISQFGESNRGD